MAIDRQTRSDVLRFHRAEGWPVGTTAAFLHPLQYRETRALRRLEGAPFASEDDDPFLPFVKEQLEKKSSLPARMLHEQVWKRGYGGVDHFRAS